MPDLSQTTKTIIMVMVAMVIVITILIPTVQEVVARDDTSTIPPGELYRYTPTFNLDDVNINISGDAIEYLDVSEDGKTITGSFPSEGEYTYTITAYTNLPTQIATQEITVVVTEDDYYKVRPLFYAIPTFVIVGIIVIIARTFMMNGGGGGGDMGGGLSGGGLSGESISGSLDGFKDRFSGGYGKR